MSVFTNPADAAADQAEAYIRATLELLGDRDPTDVLARLPDELATRLEGFDDSSLRRPEAPGQWSAIEVVQHLADSELVWAWRLRRILTADRPTLEGFDQDLWCERLGYRDAPLEEGLAVVAVVRPANLRLVRSLGNAAMGRVGLHAERGEESVAHLLRLYAGHDLVHLRQLDRIRAAVRDPA